MNSLKLKGSLVNWLDKDEMNGVRMLDMQLSYSWLNSFVRNHQQSAIHEFTKIERLPDKTA